MTPLQSCDVLGADPGRLVAHGELVAVAAPGPLAAHDELADIAVAAGGGATVLLGDGKGGFSREVVPAYLRGRLKKATLQARGDLDGNGLEDFAVADPAHRTITFSFQLPGGHFSTCSLRLDVTPDFITLADVNHNGLADLVIASRHVGGVTVLLSGASRVDHMARN